MTRADYGGQRKSIEILIDICNTQVTFDTAINIPKIT
jgi:hypothetical protein